MDRQQDVIRRITAHVVAYRFALENERHRNMSRLKDKLAAAAAVAPRQAAKIEARADAIIASESELENLTDDAFAGHEALLDEARKGVQDLKHELATMSNSPPLEHSTPLPGGPRVLPDGPAGVGDLNLPGPVGTRVALGPHPDQPEGQQAAWGQTVIPATVTTSAQQATKVENPPVIPASQQAGSASAQPDPQ